MDLLDEMRQQFAVYWSPTGTDDYNHTTFATAIELRVRWSERQELFISKSGQEKVSKAKVYVAQDLDLDGVLRLGGLTTVTDLLNPFANTNAWEIQAFKNVPTIDNDDNLRVAYL